MLNLKSANVCLRNHIFCSILICCIFFFPLQAFCDVEECFDCHNDPDFTTEDDDGREISMHVDPEKFASSIHGDLDCTDCHEDADPDHEELGKANCVGCHDDVEEEMKGSAHEIAMRNGMEDAPACSDCHGSHYIFASSNPKSMVHPLNLAATCAACHSDPEFAKRHDIRMADPFAAYKNSVHGIAVLSEHNFEVATCDNCHGTHDIRGMNDSSSLIYWENVPATCGACHEEIYEQYKESVHGKAVKKGVRDAPICTDCHGEHNVKDHTDPDSPVHPLRVSKQTCERCHSSELITGRYGIAEDRGATFEDSYHGLALRAGSLKAANCASCHGIHNILPSSNPRSLVYPGNLPETCGKCHENVKENVAKGPVHLTTESRPGQIVELVKNLYIWLIILTIGGMLLHNGGDFVRRALEILRKREK